MTPRGSPESREEDCSRDAESGSVRAMKRASLLAVVVATGLARTAEADVAPLPECPAGTHGEYLMGYRCVKNGHHLAEKADGRVVEVPDDPATDLGAGQAPPASRGGGCGCASGRSSNQPLVGLASLAFGAVVGVRRRRR